MEWFRAECRIDDLGRHSFFDDIDRLRAPAHYSAGSAVWLGKSYPTPDHMQIWLCFRPGLPVILRGFVENCDFIRVDEPDQGGTAIAWSEVLALTTSEPCASPAPQAAPPQSLSPSGA
jgi:hypothetical protein